MSRHWPVLAVAGILCTSIWVVLGMAVLGAGPFDQPQEFTEENNGTVQNIAEEDPADPIAVTGDEHISEDNSSPVSDSGSHAGDKPFKQGSVQEKVMEEKISRPGIYKGDFDDIAPEGIISIDVLLEELLKDDP